MQPPLTGWDLTCNYISGFTDGCCTGSEPYIRGPLDARRRDAQPHAVAPRSARTDGIRALRRASAAAIDGEPAPEDAGRCELGRLAPGRHQPLLHARTRWPGHVDQA